MNTESSSTINQVLGVMAGQPEAQPEQQPEPEPEQPQESEPEQRLEAEQHEDQAHQEQPEQEAETPEAEAEPQKPNFKQLAEQLGLDVADLYNVEVGMGGDSEPVTLGQLKDGFKDVQNLAAERQEFDNARLTSENEMLRARQELSMLVQNLPELPENYQDMMREQQKNILVREQNALLSAIPEMVDPQGAQIVNQRVFNLGQEYGFSAAELGYIQDHRIVKLVNDYGKLKERLASADAKIKKVPRGPKKPAKNSHVGKNKLNEMNRKDLISKAKAGDRQAQQTALVRALAGG